MAGSRDKYYKDRLKLILFGFLGLAFLLSYISLVGQFGNYAIASLLSIFIVWYLKRSPAKRLILRQKFNDIKSRVAGKFIKGIVAKVPTVIWGGFAILGIFLVGMLVGFSVSDFPDTSVPNEVSEQKEDYANIINAYEELTNLFLYQNQDAEIMSDYDMMINHPEEVKEAVQSYRQKRDEIIFQAGRIAELRKKAGLTVKNRL